MAKVMIIVTVPAEHSTAVLEAIASAGGGVLGNYTHCAFTSEGHGRFKPNADANPHIGAKEQVNTVPEVRIETFSEHDRVKAVTAAIRQAHPYEEPVIYLLPLLSEDDL